MKISMAGETAANGAHGSTEMLIKEGGDVELASLGMARIMAGEGRSS